MGDVSEKQMARNREKFQEASKVFEAVIKEIDFIFQSRRNDIKDGKINVINEGFVSKKDFLMYVEEEAISRVATAMGKKIPLVKECWKILTLPPPICSELESGVLTLVKAQLAIPLCLDPFDDKAIESAERLVRVMLGEDDLGKIKEAVKEESKKVWFSNTAVVDQLMRQSQH